MYPLSRWWVQQPLGKSSLSGKRNLLFCILKLSLTHGSCSWESGLVFWACFCSLCQVTYRAGHDFPGDELTHTPSKVILMYIQTLLRAGPSTRAGPERWQPRPRWMGRRRATPISDALTAPRSDAWANRGDVSPGNRWQSPFSRAPLSPALRGLLERSVLVN